MTRWLSVFTAIISLTVVSQISPLYADDAVPVLMWGGTPDPNLETNNAVNPFVKTSCEELNSGLQKKLNDGQGDSPVLAYVKKNLCIEDLKEHKQHLQEATSGVLLHYLPAVDEPLSCILTSLSSYNQSFDTDVDSISDGQLVIKSITDLDSIPETYKTIKESSPNLVAILLGKSCSYRRSERVKRDTLADSSSPTPFTIKDRVLLYAREPPTFRMSAEKDIIQFPDNPTSIITGIGTRESPLVLNIHFTGNDSSINKHTFLFTFLVQSTGYYSLKTVTYKNDNSDVLYLTTKNDIVFPFNFSYHCGQNIVFQNGSASLNLTDIQVQIDAKSFGDVYDCVGFTTIPIWTGIFVTAILALIMIWGLTMIMDIRTMDRFDDPKGKTITISAQE